MEASGASKSSFPISRSTACLGKGSHNFTTSSWFNERVIQVKGHAWWPAYVSGMDYVGGKVEVNFLAASEHAALRPDQLLPYAKGRLRHSRPGRNPQRIRAIFQAERCPTFFLTSQKGND